MSKLYRFKAEVLAQKAKAAGDSTNFLIAVRTGVRESTISRILNEHTTPSLETACAIASAYGTTLDDLVACLTATVTVPAQRTEAAA
ncbi:helix-turn-helix transcriptional regulator [Streptomyces sp. NPDC001552]|uniref:helix-turn-helix transcriptional regulator n=1 Tax=Streptomyces sp. NPDC001552 TaxID=3364587 RepID=UPI0036C3A800